MTITLTPRVGGWSLLAVLILVAALFRLWPTARDVEHTVILHLTPKEVLRDIPVVHQTFVDRILWRTTPPETVKVSVAHVDSSAARFCQNAAAQADTSARDSTARVSPLLVLNAGRYADRRLELFGFRSDGSVYAGIFAPRIPFEFGVNADTAWAREKRHLPAIGGLLLDVLKIGAAGFAGYEIGRR